VETVENGGGSEFFGGKTQGGSPWQSTQSFRTGEAVSAVPSHAWKKKNHSTSGGLLMRDKFNELITTL
jgi:hypothetical protein